MTLTPSAGNTLSRTFSLHFCPPPLLRRRSAILYYERIRLSVSPFRLLNLPKSARFSEWRGIHILTHPSLGENLLEQLLGSACGLVPRKDSRMEDKCR